MSGNSPRLLFPTHPSNDDFYLNKHYESRERRPRLKNDERLGNLRNVPFLRDRIVTLRAIGTPDTDPTLKTLLQLYAFLQNYNTIEYGDMSVLDAIYTPDCKQIKRIGKGAHSEFFEAKFSDKTVFVKELKPVNSRHYSLIRSEIEANFYMTEVIPEAVSKVLAAVLWIRPLVKDGKVIEVLIDCKIVYEYQKGLSLLDYLNAMLKKMDPRHMDPKAEYEEEIRNVYCMAMRSIAKIHDLGFVHRDIKPDNLYVVLDEDNVPTRVLVIDLGFLEREGDATELRGTPGYMPYRHWRKTNSGRSEFVEADEEGKPLFLWTGKSYRSNNDYAMSHMWREIRRYGLARLFPDMPKCAPTATGTVASASASASTATVSAGAGGSGNAGGSGSSGNAGSSAGHGGHRKARNTAKTLKRRKRTGTGA